MIISGTRPEIIKLAPVYLALQAQASVSWVHSGQHTSIADSAFSEFDIRPDIVLSRPAAPSLGGLLAGLIASLTTVIEARRPRVVLVHGDTSSTLAGCLAAFHAQVPVIGHVEAGLRSADLANPFPEEANRKLVAQLANRHYAPLSAARDNLLREGIAEARILVTGNTVVDAQHILLSGAETSGQRDQVLVTCHRRENWQHMESICAAIGRLARAKPDLAFKFVMHPNPDLQQLISGFLGGIQNIQLLQPLAYRALQVALRDSCCVLTDSGGIQEEAPSYGVKAVVVRRYTERMESIQAGMSALVDPDNTNAIYAKVLQYIEEGPQQPSQLYGDGKAAKRIADDITTTLSECSL